MAFHSHEPKKEVPNSKRKKASSSWDQIKNLLITCKQIEDSKIHHPSKNPRPNFYSTCTDICRLRDVAHGNTKIINRHDKSRQETRLLSRYRSSSSRSNNSSSVRPSAVGAGPNGRGLQLRKLSGCYECHSIVDPTR